MLNEALAFVLERISALQSRVSSQRVEMCRRTGASCTMGHFAKVWPNLVPRSHSVTGNVRSGKVRFRACSVPARPEIRAFLSLRMFVLSVVILDDLAE